MRGSLRKKADTRPMDKIQDDAVRVCFADAVVV